ncbi:hypothetical protein [Geodermatophilus nigrescens]|uniref:EVE domain-containing protein n=1 Tax=Geodermatophilus nigrescens TaxID=1070870 RepID=A0A1M5JQ68_9ACTN|nr:hypothetical protein [Geodermatophilus nigrescens]SHG42726.1 hypothetical protein SAMN05444351_2606 [Geodermatophilus nigrescens]
MPSHWILKSNPQVWNVWEWWEKEDTELNSWTISRRIDQIGPGDDFALWVTGPEAGVYAFGKVVGQPQGPGYAGGGYWETPPEGPVWDVELATEGYFFESPIYKSELAADPDFADALILRVPAAANPLSLTDVQWDALVRHFPGAGSTSRPRTDEVVVTSRRVGLPPSDTDYEVGTTERKLAFREARLLQAFERQHPHPLTRQRVRLPDGDSIECDAYDAVDDLVIEAKGSAGRDDVRTAIGQLLDYRRHIGSNPSMAVLFPEDPSSDLRELLAECDITVIVLRGGVFTRL